MSIEEHSRIAKLIGTAYMVLATMKLFNHPFTYAELERVMVEQKHCSPVELMQVCQELHRYNALIIQAEEGKVITIL